tara:strand:- start:468 stop:647 length:180 start_codon:yes stop_codon:yes gene_type:complete
MSLELILAMTIAANILMAFRIYRLEHSLRYTDIMVHAIMEEGAPKLHANFERFEETRDE